MTPVTQGIRRSESLCASAGLIAIDPVGPIVRKSEGDTVK